jgi:UPF0271 protein
MTVDLNADVGESFGRYVLGHDTALMPHVTSVNVACGFHAGDAHVMRRTVQFARECGLSIGAHPGFPDLAGFGRRPMSLSVAEIEDIIVYQVGALTGMATACGTSLTHVKPHGALYNAASEDFAIASAVARGVVTVNRHLLLVGLANSQVIRAGREAGLRTASEVFADRGYDDDGQLLERGVAGAVIHDLDAVCQRAVWMVEHRAVPTPRGSVSCDVDTICIHGDTPGAAALAQAVRGALETAGVKVTAMSADRRLASQRGR